MTDKLQIMDKINLKGYQTDALIEFIDACMSSYNVVNADILIAFIRDNTVEDKKLTNRQMRGKILKDSWEVVRGATIDGGYEQVVMWEDLKEILNSLEDEVRNLCPDCKEEVEWVKGWYDCPNHGQLKEHPLYDTIEDEGEEHYCPVCKQGDTCHCGEYAP